MRLDVETAAEDAMRHAHEGDRAAIFVYDHAQVARSINFWFLRTKHSNRVEITMREKNNLAYIPVGVGLLGMFTIECRIETDALLGVKWLASGIRKYERNINHGL